MATELGIMESYCTVNEADTFLPLKEDWLDADSEVKEDALLWGRYYIDANFDCVIDADAIDDRVKFANSLLAYDYFKKGDLFFDNESAIKKKRVKGGPVETEREYVSGLVNHSPDSLSKVKSILKDLCSATTSMLKRV